MGILKLVGDSKLNLDMKLNEIKQPSVRECAKFLKIDKGIEIQSTKPYYFDGPESLVSEKVQLGFGDHGFEPRLEGPTTDMFIGAIQDDIKKHILEILKLNI